MASLSIDLRTDYIPGVDFERVRTEIRSLNDVNPKDSLYHVLAPINPSDGRTAEFAAGSRIAEFKGLSNDYYALHVYLESDRVIAFKPSIYVLNGNEGYTVTINKKEETIVLDRDEGNILLGGNDKDGDLFMENTEGVSTIHLNGENGAISLGGYQEDGDIFVRNRGGATTIRMDGGLGRLRLNNSNGEETIRLDGRRGRILVNREELNVPDYVFDPSYELMELETLKTHLSQNRHLPDVPSERELKEEGLDLTDFSMKLLKKIEELTLYTIQLNEKIKKLES